MTHFFNVCVHNMNDKKVIIYNILQVFIQFAYIHIHIIWTTKKKLNKYSVQHIYIIYISYILTQFYTM